MSRLRRRIDRLERRGSPELLAVTFLAEDPTPEARAFERRGGCLTVRLGTDANLQAAALDPGAFLPPGPEREACRHARVKIYLEIGPEHLCSRPTPSGGVQDLRIRPASESFR
jgi:hypothetical protein